MFKFKEKVTLINYHINEMKIKISFNYFERKFELIYKCQSMNHVLKFLNQIKVHSSSF